ncbi:hypothetical protein [Methanosarcina sp. UBA5]|nr:hypothetical protein [Methanosarcina sp. UBA5]
MRINEDVVEGRFLSLVHTRYGIVLGDKLAEKYLGVQLGDRVDAVFPGS